MGSKEVFMEAKDVMEKLSEYKKIYEAANLKALEAIKAVKIELDNATREGEEYKKALVEKLIPALGKYLNDENECDCQHRVPDDMVVQDTGLRIRFQANHPNDIISYTVPYDELDM